MTVWETRKLSQKLSLCRNLTHELFDDYRSAHLVKALTESIKKHDTQDGTLWHLEAERWDLPGMNDGTCFKVWNIPMNQKHRSVSGHQCFILHHTHQIATALYITQVEVLVTYEHALYLWTGTGCPIILSRKHLLFATKVHSLTSPTGN